MSYDIAQLEVTLQRTIGNQITLIQEGNDRFPIFVPFQMEDGDHFNIVLKASPNGEIWTLTDEGHTLMHLSYWMEADSLNKGTRANVIARVLRQFNVENREGELNLTVPTENVAHAFFSFLQALTRVTDITFLSWEQARSTFLEDFRSFIQQTVPQERVLFDYFHPQYDKQQKYRIDARINSMETPLYVFAISGDDRCRDATITLLNYDKWQVNYEAVAVFQDQQLIARDVLARFSDVAGKQFSSLDANKPEIGNYIRKKIRT